MRKQVNELLNKANLYSSRSFPELYRMIHQENFHSAIHYYLLECLGAMEHLLTAGDEKMDLKQVLF